MPRHIFRLAQRAAGVLLHPTSLPGPHGIGDLGPAAHEFVDFLAAAGLRWWQMLPLGPPGPGHSPYSARSAFAGSPLLISLDGLVADGWLTPADARPPRGLPAGRVAYPAVARYKRGRLRLAFEAFTQAGGPASAAYVRFCRSQAAWLDDYALFAALATAQRSTTWTGWPTEWRRPRAGGGPRPGRGSDHGRGSDQGLARAIEFERFVQFAFDRQWTALHKHAQARGVGLIGDLPIFVAHESADVWAHPELFDLDAAGRARTVSGVPPDLFSRTGQRWGHPHYRWSRHAATGFAWWIARLRRLFEQFDAARIDHFLGFSRVWAVPGRARTARRGRWVATPGAELFAAVRRALGPLEIIAEDLGLLTPAAAALRDRLGLPGMRLIQFAFGGDAGSRYHLPHNHPRRCATYPGTHDNDTVAGWLESLRAADRRARSDASSAYRRLLRYCGQSTVNHWDVIRLVLQSPADLAIIPLQDLLGLGSAARMNTPATERGNWAWRLTDARPLQRLSERMRELLDTYDRLPPP